MIIGVFPGQGSQTPGFLTPWLDLPGVRDRVTEAGEAAGVDLVSAGTVWDADRIRDTSVAQPLIVAASLVSFEVFQQRGGRIAGTAGHSVGEIPALVAAGLVSVGDAMRLVGTRGRAMAAAAADVETGMSAIVGGSPETVEDAIRRAGLVGANINGAGQVVAAGTREQLDALEAPRGARVIPLQVAGAFHTEWMSAASRPLADAVADISPSAAPSIPLWSNRDGARVTSGRDALDRIVTQVSSPVRWDLVTAGLADAGVTGLIEFAPAGALTGLAKRGLPGVTTVAVKTPDDLDAAVDLATAKDVS